MNNLRPRCYIAGPLTSQTGKEQEHVDRATDAARSLFAEGWAPLVPHWSWYADEAMGLSWEEWLIWDMPWVAVADAVYRLDGPSLGAEREVNLARTLGIPVFFEADGIPEARQNSTMFNELMQAASLEEEAPVVKVDEQPLTILEEAKTLISGSRQEDYGHPLEDFSRSAAIMSAILGSEVRAEQVPLLMIAVKLSREVNRPKRDNIVDLAGYAGTLELVRDKIGGW